MMFASFSICVDLGILLDLDGAVAGVSGGDEAEAAAALGFGKGALLLAGLDALAVGVDPDLHEVDGRGRRGIELAKVK